MEKLKRYYTPAEAAAILDVSSSTVLRMIADGRLFAVRVSPRVFRIPIPTFNRFVSGEKMPDFKVPVRHVDRLPERGEGEVLPEPRDLRDVL